MTAPCAVRRSSILTAAFVACTATLAAANTLPPGPVLGHPADYVIVTPAAFAPAFQPLTKWRTKQGLPAVVKTMESIVAEYPGGRDDAERVRMFLEDAHDQWGTHWVLLGGVPPYVPARRVHSTFFGGSDFVTDLYFGALKGTWDADGDGIFGEGYVSASDPGDGVDLHADVFVGRAPVRSAAEAQDFVQKTLLAGFEPFLPAPTHVLSAADVLFPNPWTPGTPLTIDGAELAEQVLPPLAAIPGAEITRLYQNWDDSRWPGALPLDASSLLAALHEGPDFYFDENRGGPLVITAGNDTVPASAFDGLSDAPRPAQAWINGSLCGNFEGDCLAAHFVRGARGGAATCVAPSRLTFVTTTFYYLQNYVVEVAPPNAHSVGEALALCKAPFLDFAQYDGVHRETIMAYNLFGDPTLKVRLPARPPIAARFDPAVAAGPPGFDVLVERDGSPVAGARVTALIDDEALAIGTTGADGVGRLEMPDGSAGSADLTITAPDGASLAGTLTVGVVTAVGGAVNALRFAAPQPNPAFASARFSGAVAGPAALEIFDVGGRRVRAFALESGAFDLVWDLRDAGGRRVAPGLYLARLGTAAGVRVQRLLVGR